LKYSQDGDIFFNRQLLLPRREAGYYREYTVETPGSPDRGRRRLVVGGASAEVYYSDDHNRTFCRVVEANG
jgi:ribonuclease T1